MNVDKHPSAYPKSCHNPIFFQFLFNTKDRIVQFIPDTPCASTSSGVMTSCQWVSKGREGRTEICSKLPFWCPHTSVHGTLCGVLLTPPRNVSESWWVAIWSSSYTTTVGQLSGSAAAHGADAELSAWAGSPHLGKGSDSPLNKCLWTQCVQQHSVAVWHPPSSAAPLA